MQDESVNSDHTIISLSPDTFSKLFDAKLSPQQAFIQGKIKVRGNMNAAMKLNPLIASLAAK